MSILVVEEYKWTIVSFGEMPGYKKSLSLLQLLVLPLPLLQLQVRILIDAKTATDKTFTTYIKKPFSVAVCHQETRINRCNFKANNKLVKREIKAVERLWGELKPELSYSKLGTARITIFAFQRVIQRIRKAWGDNWRLELPIVTFLNFKKPINICAPLAILLDVEL